MARWGFLYNQIRCIGCNACQMACKDKHNLETDMFFRKVETLEYKEQGEVKWMHYSGACNHCLDAACVKSCPTKALHYNEEGIVLHHRGKCIGCGVCTWSCPYGAPKLSHRLGVSMKCDSCIEERKKGKKPVCVEACLTHCLDFRNLAKMTETEKESLVSDLPILPDASGTSPSLLIKRKL